MIHITPPEEDIMVIKSTFLPQIQKGKKGFISPEEKDIEKVILENCDFMKEIHAEKNLLFKEVIPYAVVYNSRLKKVLIYQEIDEKNPWALSARIVLGLKIYVKEKMGSRVNMLRDIIIETLQKHLLINFAHIASVELLGFVYNEEYTNERSKIGLFYLVETLGESESIGGDQFGSAQYMTLEELKIYVESGEIEVGFWSELIFPSLEKKIQQLEIKNK